MLNLKAIPLLMALICCCLWNSQVWKWPPSITKFHACIAAFSWSRKTQRKASGKKRDVEFFSLLLLSYFKKQWWCSCTQPPPGWKQPDFFRSTLQEENFRLHLMFFRVLFAWEKTKTDGVSHPCFLLYFKILVKRMWGASEAAFPLLMCKKCCRHSDNVENIWHEHLQYGNLPSATR